MSIIGIVLLDSVAVDGLYIIETDGGDRALPADLFPRRNQSWQLFGDYQRLSILAVCKNTLFITVLVVFGNVLSNSFIAYGFAKLAFPGKNLIFALVLSTMMIPGFVTMIPQYVLFSKIGWVGTYLPLIVPAFFGNAFNIFLMRQFYLSVNNELIEAAKIDGANHLYIWSHLMIPLTKPALITIAINSFNGAWNDFLGPLLYIQNQESTRCRLACKSSKTNQRPSGTT